MTLPNNKKEFPDLDEYYKQNKVETMITKSTLFCNEKISEALT